MSGTGLQRTAAALPMAVLFLLPLGAALLSLLPGLADASGFRDLVRHPQFAGALTLTLATGLASTLATLVLALVIVFAANGKNVLGSASLFLAVPHVSLAIGLAFLIMPTGLLARMVGLAVGWTAPPQWLTTQDPWGLALTVALVLKETPFLVWALASQLNREDMRRSLEGQVAMARSLGHGPGSVFLRIVLPQLLPRVTGPLIAVLAYSLTVVDMALVIGPTQPPTLAQLVWTDINDAEQVAEARGAAGVLVLGGIVLAVVAGVALAGKIMRPSLRRLLVLPPGQGSTSPARLLPVQRLLWPLFLGLYAIVLAVTVLQTIAGHWPFPQLLPAIVTTRALESLLANLGPAVTSLWLALATSAAALAVSVAWLEWKPPESDRPVRGAAVASMCLPALLLALGEYRLFLRLGVTGTAVAMFLAHVIPVTAYVFLMLAGPYRAFDPRWHAAAAGLRAGRMHFLLRIKWPLLKAPMLAAGAVGFSVSIAQYVTAQLAAAGRFSTLTMEAVTRSSGGNRPLIAVYGVALAVLPLLVFLLASHFGKPRWSGR